MRPDWVRFECEMLCEYLKCRKKLYVQSVRIQKHHTNTHTSHCLGNNSTKNQFQAPGFHKNALKKWELKGFGYQVFGQVLSIHLSLSLSGVYVCVACL